MSRAFMSTVLKGATGRKRPPSAGQDHVVLLHGLGRTRASMRLLEWALTQAGYHVVNQGYPSRRFRVEELAAQTLPRALHACRDGAEVHFVTHSMGAALLRQWASENSIPHAGRAVLLGPPGAGSEIVDRFGDWRLFGLLNGPAGTQLGTGPDHLPAKLPPEIPLKVGVIAGSRSLNPLMSALIEGPNDGKVSVRSAFATPASDRLVLPVSHTWMMMNQAVVEAVIRFLASGSFAEPPQA